VIDPAVALLQGDLPLGRLDVRQHGLRLGRDLPARSSDHRVPSAKVAFDGQWDFRRPPEARVEPHAEPLEQSGVSDVAKWVTPGIGPESNVQPKDLTERGVFGEPGRPSSILDPLNERSRKSNRTSHGLAAQAGLLSSALELCPKPRLVLLRNTNRPTDGSNPSDHSATIAVRALPAVRCPSPGRYVGNRAHQELETGSRRLVTRRSARSAGSSSLRRSFGRPIAREAGNR
jgi:hypothetical protein